MASIRKYALTKKDLIDNGYFVEGEKVFKNCYSKKHGHSVRLLKNHVVTKKRKYGGCKSYLYVPVMIERLKDVKKRIYIGLHTVIYAWYKGEVQLGYDIDHLDNNPFNNNIDNLELVTHAENMRRRKLNINHWYYIKGYDKESWAKRQQELTIERNNKKLRKELRESKKQADELRKQLRTQYKDIKNNLELQIKEAKNSGDKKLWHELVKKRMSRKEYINKCMEEC